VSVCVIGGCRTRRSLSAGSQLRQQQTTGTPAAPTARPISVRFCESVATSHSLTSFTELATRPQSRPPVFDNVDTTTTPSVVYLLDGNLPPIGLQTAPSQHIISNVLTAL